MLVSSFARAINTFIHKFNFQAKWKNWRKELNITATDNPKTSYKKTQRRVLGFPISRNSINQNGNGRSEQWRDVVPRGTRGQAMRRTLR